MLDESAGHSRLNRSSVTEHELCSSLGVFFCWLTTVQELLGTEVLPSLSHVEKWCRTKEPMRFEKSKQKPKSNKLRNCINENLECI